MSDKPSKYSKIAINGVAGSNSDMVRRLLYPEATTLPFLTFEDAFLSLKSGAADLAVIPVDNNLAGRVADVHRLLADHPFHIIAEHFQPIDFALMGVRGAALSGVTDVYSHVHALPQCSRIIKELGLTAHIHADTAGAAADVATWADPTKAALAPPLAAEIYGLDILKAHVGDELGAAKQTEGLFVNEKKQTEGLFAYKNMTRFVVLSRERTLPATDKPCLTSLHFTVRNIPAALYKALGGFATNAVQMAKLESYVDAQFKTAKFYAEIIGHPNSREVGLALEELAFFAKDIRLMGTYEAHPFRDLT